MLGIISLIAQQFRVCHRPSRLSTTGAAACVVGCTANPCVSPPVSVVAEQHVSWLFQAIKKLPYGWYLLDSCECAAAFVFLPQALRRVPHHADCWSSLHSPPCKTLHLQRGSTTFVAEKKCLRLVTPPRVSPPPFAR